MAPRKATSEPTFKPTLTNSPGRGLGWRDRDGVFRGVAKVSIKCVAPIALMMKNLIGISSNY